MKPRKTTALLLAVAVIGLAGAKAAPAIVESWVSTTHSREFKKLMVIAITDDQETRHHFEDKFVGRLRSHRVEGVTSHSLVADLQDVGDRQALLDSILEQRVDGAISVRLIPLAKKDEGWARDWTAGMERDFTFRDLVEETLPVRPSADSRYGLEIAVWDTENGYRVWSGRTNIHKIKQLREGSGDFIEYTVGALRDARLLP